MPALLVVALLVVPLVELYVLIQVGQALGALPTVALLLTMSLLGAFLLRREGTRTFRALRTTLQAGRMPAREVADGALVILGGALLLTPGFATDVFGLLLILPPSRAVLRRLLTSVVARRLSGVGLVGGLGSSPGRGPGSGPGRGPGGATAPRRPSPGAGRVVDGEVVDRSPFDQDPAHDNRWRDQT